MGVKGEGIYFPLKWFDEDPDYQFLVLTHEYFHTTPSLSMLDHYDALQAGKINTLENALREPTCLGALVGWVYSGKDLQSTYGGIKSLSPSVD